VKTQLLQDRLDILIERVFLWAIPGWVRPNWLTYLRMLTVPVIAWLLYSGQAIPAFLLFVFSASTDFLDGAMARRRNQITDLGRVIDPIADKMLIATILIYVGFEYLIVKIFLIFILLEIGAVLSGSALSYRFGEPVGANVYGKIKMIIQSISVLILLAGIFSHNDYLIAASVSLLYVALVFAILAGIKVFRNKHKVVRKQIRVLLRLDR
jgi:CDP-diacylglycerol--glycerol-3-phosphate 3-phosphatidyltransferase